MARKLAEAERELGVALPKAAARFVLAPKECQFFDPPCWEDVLALKNLWPGMPCRVLPLVEVGDGDSISLFFPRGGGRPFLVSFDHEQSVIEPLTSDSGFFFENPDHFSPHNPEYDKRPPKCDISAWAGLLIDTQGSVASELELFKPMSLHYRDVEQRLEWKFGPLFRHFGSEGAAAGMVRECFCDPAHLEDRKRWFRLSEGLAQVGLWREAIQALDNCHALHFVYPRYCGSAEMKGWLWQPVLEVLERMLALVKVHGDRFDQVAIPHQVKVAREFAKG